MNGLSGRFRLRLNFVFTKGRCIKRRPVKGVRVPSKDRLIINFVVLSVGCVLKVKSEVVPPPLSDSAKERYMIYRAAMCN